jgi:S1-C subfamily serine protease
MKLRLQAIDSPKKPMFDFAGPTITIGRDAGCDLPMPGTSNVSGRHAQITLTPEGALLLDLESTNGTFLNDRRLEGRKKIRKGDYFRLGQTGPCFQVVELDLTSAAPMPAPAIAGTAREKVPSAPAPRSAAADYTAAPAMPAAPKAKPTPAPVAPPEPIAAAKSAPPSTGQTRLMVVELQKKNQTLIIAGIATVAGLLFIGAATGIYFIWSHHSLSTRTANLDETTKKLQTKTDDLNESVGKVATNVEKLGQRESDVYRKLLPSTTWILRQQKSSFGAGTGALIDAERRLVLSNHHVASQGTSVMIFFPVLDTGSKAKMSTNDYPYSQSIPGKTVFSDPKCDLCLIQLDHLPADPRPLKLAPKSADPGDRVHSIGNFRCFGQPSSTIVKDGVLWSYAGGTVRNIRQNRMKLDNGQLFDAWVLETQSPINQGDSGGPVVSDAGELIAVVSSFDPSRRVVSSFIDVREVHAFVGRFR